MSDVSDQADRSGPDLAAFDADVNRDSAPRPRLAWGAPPEVPRPPVSERKRRSARRHSVLLVLTVLTTAYAGAYHYAGFSLGFDPGIEALAGFEQMAWAPFLMSGLWYSATILAILGCHEMGHYLACRYYRVDASLPYFLPAPFPMTGTFGAFIRIRSRIPSKIALFDIGIAGPIAGFIVAVPALVIGLSLSTVERVPQDFGGAELGEPLLFRLAARLIIGSMAEGYSVNMHPVAFASWFGLIATALNLFPIGQLDGGHITYAVLGRRAVWITILMVLAAIGLTIMSTSWLVWTVLLIIMLFVVGPHHPPTLDDDTPLDRGRLLLAGVALVMLIVCFTPAPIEPFVGLE